MFEISDIVILSWRFCCCTTDQYVMYVANRSPKLSSISLHGCKVVTDAVASALVKDVASCRAPICHAVKCRLQV
jgi:hypothetical protein